MPRTPRSNIDVPTRAAIIALRCEGRGWTYISEKVANCSPSGVQQFVERLLRRANMDPKTAPTELPLNKLLKLIENPNNRGRPRRPPGPA